MNDRLRKILKGGNIKPKTADEVAVKYAIDNAGSGGGADLPEPGTAGNVLTSTGSGWESAAPSKEEFVITADYDYLNNLATNIVPSSFAAIAAAVAAGKTIKVVLTDDTIDLVINGFITMVSGSNLFGTAIVYNGLVDNYQCGVVLINGSLDDGVGISLIARDMLLPVSASENGQLLGVDNGAYSFVDSKAPLIVSGTFAEGSPTTVTITAELADIYAAADAGRTVYLEYTNTDGQTGAVDTTRLTLHTRVKVPNQSDPSVYDYALGFYMPYMESNKPAVGEVLFANSKVGIFDLQAAQ